jgi:hypothetical protein
MIVTGNLREFHICRHSSSSRRSTQSGSPTIDQARAHGLARRVSNEVPRDFGCSSWAYQHLKPMSSMLTVAGGVVLGWIAFAANLSAPQGSGQEQLILNLVHLGNCRHAPSGR